LSHLYIKTNILPRQARDKHRENSKKDAVFRTWHSLPSDNGPDQFLPGGAAAPFAELKENAALIFECSFPYVCPEPGLVKGSFLYAKMAQRRRFLT
jgi:hypothetical protein